MGIKGKAMVPVHLGMFDLALHTWYGPINRVTREANKRGFFIIAPQTGATYFDTTKLFARRMVVTNDREYRIIYFLPGL